MDAEEPQTHSNPQKQTQEEEPQNETLIQRESDQDQHKSEVQDEDQTVVQDPTVGFDTISGLDGEDFIFSDEAFAALPDFRCLSLPSSSPSNPRKSVPTSTPSYSSSSSSTSSNWPFLRAPDALPRSLPGCMSEMSKQQQPSNPDPSRETEAQLDMELLNGGVDVFDLSVPWDSAELFPVSMDESGTCSDQSFNLDQLCSGFDETNSKGLLEGEDKEDSDDLAKFFLEWLKNNKDAISPEDLRSIRLKKSTIECAARRLGPDRRGRMQLVKLILSWVQNHHLQRKKLQLQDASQPHANALLNGRPVFNPVPIDSVPNTNPNLNMDFDMNQAPNGCNSWLQTTEPYNFPQSCITNNAVVSSQLYSPASDLHATDPTNISWDQSYNPAIQSYPMTYQTGLHATQYSASPIVPLYHPGQSITTMASATREARRKRMARQRRVLSLQQSRALGQSDNAAQCGLVGQGNSSARSWAYWSSLALNAHQGKGMMDLNLVPGSSSSTSQTMHGSGQPERGILRHGGSASERRQGLKSYDKNMRFLLQKVLKQSDVGNLGRIVLPKKEAEIHMPELDSRDGITIPMEDIATSRVWNMRYRFWPNNKSRMYLLENTGDFVRCNGLEEGDFIVIYSDVKSGKYMIRGVKVKLTQEKGRSKVDEKRIDSERNREESSASVSLQLSDGKTVN
ncbi:B3 domain-containing protein VP1-like [Carex rostrata]